MLLHLVYMTLKKITDKRATYILLFLHFVCCLLSVDCEFVSVGFFYDTSALNNYLIFY